MTIGVLLVLVPVASALALALALLGDDSKRRPVRIYLPRLDPAASTMRGAVMDRQGRLRGW